MKCVNHPEKDASGSCVYCGKLFCPDCLVNVKGRMYCKDDVANVFDEEKEKAEKSQTQTPMVFMNAGGGGGGSSSSSSSSGSGAGLDSGQLVPKKNKVIAAILSFLLGWIGIHKFYLGQPVQGIVYLCLFWTGIPLLISLIEGLIYLFTSDHIFARKYGGWVV